MENKEKNVEMGFSVVKNRHLLPEVTDKKNITKMGIMGY